VCVANQRDLNLVQLHCLLGWVVVAQPQMSRDYRVAAARAGMGAAVRVPARSSPCRRRLHGKRKQQD
jgi:hypothetical protein